MATSVLPSPASAAQPAAPGTPPSAPPNFYAQAASAHPPVAQPDYSEQNRQFKSAVEKLLTIFDKMEKMTPNGQKIDKDIRGMAQALKSTRDRVFEGEEGAGAGEDGEGKGAAGAVASGGQATGTGGESKAAGAPLAPAPPTAPLAPLAPAVG